MNQTAPLINKTDYCFGVISDTHGLLRPMIYSAFQHVDAILHAGDFDCRAIFDKLKTIAPVIGVRGNMDQGHWADRLPREEVLKAGEIFICMVHNIYTLDLEPSSADIRIVISGHTHQPNIYEQNQVFFLNPGSAGPKRLDYPISAALLKIHHNQPTATLINLDA